MKTLIAKAHRIAIHQFMSILIGMFCLLVISAISGCSSSNPTDSNNLGNGSSPAGWFLQNPLPQGEALNSVSFTDSNNGTAVGSFGIILHTTDGGANWKLQTILTSSSFIGVNFTDANIGTVVGSGGIILRTTDGGGN